LKTKTADVVNSVNKNQRTIIITEYVLIIVDSKRNLGGLLFQRLLK